MRINLETKKQSSTMKNKTIDVIKAMRKGSREAERELLGDGFHAKLRVHKSKKTYTRKLKHKSSNGF